MTVEADSLVAPCHHAVVRRIMPTNIPLTPETINKIAVRLSEELKRTVTCCSVNGQLGVTADAPLDYDEFRRTTSKVLASVQNGSS